MGHGGHGHIAGQFGVGTVIAGLVPGDEAAKLAELQAGGRKVGAAAASPERRRVRRWFPGRAAVLGQR